MKFIDFVICFFVFDFLVWVILKKFGSKSKFCEKCKGKKFCKKKQKQTKNT